MFCLYLLLCNGIAYTLGIQPKTDAKRMVEPLSRGKTSIDELTQFSNPDSFDYDFSNDLKKEADREDEVTLTTTNLFDANEIEETTTIRSRATRLRKKFTRISTTEIPATTTTILPTTITTTIPRSTTPTMRPTFRKFTRFTDTTTAFTPTTRSLLRFTQQSLFATIRPSKSRVAPKPLLLDHPEFRHAGPTYNCPVLNPLEQGEPSSRNDDSCDLLLPGFSKDGSCRCTYNVRDRDDKGCPTGFYFTCKRWNRT
ncbi:unnamed protein product, partial [Mesorhabditis spiculigera]